MKHSKKRILNILASALMVTWAALTVLSVTWGVLFNWPDFVHVNYGFPFVWATHTLNTIVGPVDVWKVDLQTLTIDLGLWLGSMVIAIALILQISSRKGDS